MNTSDKEEDAAEPFLDRIHSKIEATKQEGEKESLKWENQIKKVILEPKTEFERKKPKKMRQYNLE